MKLTNFRKSLNRYLTASLAAGLIFTGCSTEPQPDSETNALISAQKVTDEAIVKKLQQAPVVLSYLKALSSVRPGSTQPISGNMAKALEPFIQKEQDQFFKFLFSVGTLVDKASQKDDIATARTELVKLIIEDVESVASFLRYLLADGEMPEYLKASPLTEDELAFIKDSIYADRLEAMTKTASLEEQITIYRNAMIDFARTGTKEAWASQIVMAAENISGYVEMDQISKAASGASQEVVIIVIETYEILIQVEEVPVK